MHENDSKPLTYVEFAVDPSITEWIVCGWSFEAHESLHGPYVHHVVPDGCVSLVYRTALGSQVGHLIIAGPRTQSMQVAIDAGDRYWGFEDGRGGKVRYTIAVANDTWVEVGEYLVEGMPPRKIFEMTVKRVADPK